MSDASSKHEDRQDQRDQRPQQSEGEVSTAGNSLGEPDETDVAGADAVPDKTSATVPEGNAEEDRA